MNNNVSGSVGRLLLGSALMLSACGVSDAASSQSETAKVSGRKAGYAIAGISPGMEASAVMMAAARAGYRVAHQGKGADWELELKKVSTGKKFAIGETLKGIGGHEFRKGGEMISVDYVAMPQGSVAYLVSYAAPKGLTDYNQALQISTKRYGKSSFSNRTGFRWDQWCSINVRSARDCLKHPHLTLGENPNGLSMSTQDDSVREKQTQLLRQQLGAKPSI